MKLPLGGRQSDNAEIKEKPWTSAEQALFPKKS